MNAVHYTLFTCYEHCILHFTIFMNTAPYKLFTLCGHCTQHTSYLTMFCCLQWDLPTSRAQTLYTSTCTRWWTSVHCGGDQLITAASRKTAEDDRNVVARGGEAAQEGLLLHGYCLIFHDSRQHLLVIRWCLLQAGRHYYRWQQIAAVMIIGHQSSTTKW